MASSWAARAESWFPSLISSAASSIESEASSKESLGASSSVTASSSSSLSSSWSAWSSDAFFNSSPASSTSSFRATCSSRMRLSSSSKSSMRASSSSSLERALSISLRVSMAAAWRTTASVAAWTVPWSIKARARRRSAPGFFSSMIAMPLPKRRESNGSFTFSRASLSKPLNWSMESTTSPWARATLGLSAAAISGRMMRTFPHSLVSLQIKDWRLIISLISRRRSSARMAVSLSFRMRLRSMMI